MNPFGYFPISFCIWTISDWINKYLEKIFMIKLVFQKNVSGYWKLSNYHEEKCNSTDLIYSFDKSESDILNFVPICELYVHIL